MPADRLSAGRWCIVLTAALMAGCSGQSADSPTSLENGISDPQLLETSDNPYGSATLSTSLSIRNNLSIDRLDEPVTSGIPIPEAWNATSSSLLNLLDATGAKVPSQFVVTARWGGAPDDTSRPIKWVLATFLADVPASSSSDFTLTYGSSNTTSSGLTVSTNTADTLTIETGKATFVLNKKKFSLFDKVTVDGVVTSQSTSNGLVLTDTAGTTYTSANDTPSSVTLEESGPVRIVVRVQGSMRRSDGTALTDYTAYLYFYGGKSYARLVHTIGNHQKAALNGNSYDVFNYYGKNSITFEELSNQVYLYAPSGQLSYLFPTDSGNKSGAVTDLDIYQDSSGRDYWNRYASSANNPRLQSYVQFRGYKATNGGSSLATGNQFAGWMDVSDSAKGITVGVQSFWQNFPKALAAGQDGRVRANIFPRDFASAYNFRVGEEKTTELFMYFHSGTASTAQASLVATALENPMMALATPAWYRDSGAIQEFSVPSGSLEDRLGDWKVSDDFARYEYYNDRTLLADSTNTGAAYYGAYHSLWLSSSGHPSSTDYFEDYGWSWYGNQPLEQEATGTGMSGPFNVKYNFDFGAWVQFLRSGDERWRGLADAYSKHLEQIMLHDVITETGWDIYRWKNAVFGHSEHNESGNWNSTRNYLGPVGDTAYGGQGAALHYFLTGYPASKRFVTSAAEYAYQFYKDKTYASDSDFAPSREAANVLNLLLEGFRVTGNLNYLNLVQQILEEFAAERQPYINGPVSGSSLSLPVWIFGQYYVAMGRYAQLAREYGLTAEADYATDQLAAYLDWHLTYATKRPSGWLCSYYYYNVNGSNDSSSTDMVNNWTLLLSDAFAVGYGLTGDLTFLDAAADLHHTGTQNPFYLGSSLVYSSSKEAVNHAVFGHVYMYYADHTSWPPAGHVPVPVPDPTPTPAPDPTPTPAPAPDTTAPAVSITSPASGATVSGTITATVSVSDDSGVQRVDYSLDGALLGSSSTSPFSLTFDTTSLSNGSHTLAAKATDLSGNVGSSPSVSFTVDNNRAPTAVMVLSPSSPYYPGMTITFDGSGSSDPDGDTLTYAWTFGDGGTASGKTVTHAYATAGTFTATLTVSDGQATGSASSAVTVTSSPTSVTITLTTSTGMKDTFYRASYEGNYGKADALYTYNGSSPDYRSILWFDLSSVQLPAGATVTSARLKLTCTQSSNVVNQVYRVTRSWTEGTGTYGNTKDGATWKTYNGRKYWTTAGGDYDKSTDFGYGANGIVASSTVAVGGNAFDITALVKKWLSGSMSNDGVMLTMPSNIQWMTVKYASREYSDSSKRPTLEITYTTGN